MSVDFALVSKAYPQIKGMTQDRPKYPAVEAARLYAWGARVFKTHLNEDVVAG